MMYLNCVYSPFHRKKRRYHFLKKSAIIKKIADCKIIYKKSTLSCTKIRYDVR